MKQDKPTTTRKPSAVTLQIRAHAKVLRLRAKIAEAVSRHAVQWEAGQQQESKLTDELHAAEAEYAALSGSQPEGGGE